MKLVPKDSPLYLPGRPLYRMGFNRNIFTARRTSGIVPGIITIICMVLIGLMFAWRG